MIYDKHGTMFEDNKYDVKISGFKAKDAKIIKAFGKAYLLVKSKTGGIFIYTDEECERLAEFTEKHESVNDIMNELDKYSVDIVNSYYINHNIFDAPTTKGLLKHVIDRIEKAVAHEYDK